MVIAFADWKFRVDVAATMEQTTRYSKDHCTCAYCRNFYATVDEAYPDLRPFLAKFGVYLDGPSEVMPLEPNLILVCYRVHGEVLSRGREDFWLGDVHFSVEPSEDGTFLLWAGEMDVPWVLEEDMDEVVSPANLPEFMERMRQTVLKRCFGESLTS